jgi:hypothetical protein
VTGHVLRESRDMSEVLGQCSSRGGDSDIDQRQTGAQSEVWLTRGIAVVAVAVAVVLLPARQGELAKDPSLHVLKPILHHSNLHRN